MAGATPKIIPTNIENPKDKRTDQKGIVVVKTNALIIKDNPTPKIIPTTAPNPDKTTASVKN